MTVTIKVEGLQQLGESLRGLAREVQQKAARAATAAAARVIRKAAQANAPVDSGALKAGIVIKRIPPGESSLTSEHIVTVSTRQMRKYAAKSRAAIVELEGPIRSVNVNGRKVRNQKLLARKEEFEDLGDFFYAKFLEFGTVKMPARPFMQPAFAQNKSQAVEAAKKVLAAHIKRAGKRGK